MISAYPEYSRKFNFAKTAQNVNLVMDAVREIRALRTDMNVPQNKKTAIYIVANEGREKLMKQSAGYIEKLASGNEIKFAKPDVKSVTIATEIAQFFIPMGDLVDTEKEIARLEKELATTESEIARANGKLNNQGFVAKAPPALIESEKAKLEKYNQLKEKILASIESLKNS